MKSRTKIPDGLREETVSRPFPETSSTCPRPVPETSGGRPYRAPKLSRLCPYGIGLFGVTDEASLVDVLAGKPDIGSGGRRNVPAGNICSLILPGTGNFAALLSRVIFIREAALGATAGSVERARNRLDTMIQKGAGAPKGNQNAVKSETTVDNVNNCSIDDRPTGNAVDAGLRRLRKAAEAGDSRARMWLDDVLAGARIAPSNALPTGFQPLPTHARPASPSIERAAAGARHHIGKST